eukprot:PhF_6_TR43666/c0_g1_i1/m.67101/K13239/PECI; peroxisomal 3,2-trans-enoyl-CoA isomerase
MQTINVRASLRDNIGWITITRPNVGNAINLATYTDLGLALDWAAATPDVKLTAIVGEGKFFSTGADVTAGGLGVRGVLYYLVGQLGRFMASALRDHPVALTQKLIEFPKPIVAVVNGPVVGQTAGMLGLMDAVWVFESASLETPFMKLGLIPEGGSSRTFPVTMKPSMANEVLLLGRKLTAQEMVQQGFASRVVSSVESAQKELQAIARDAPATSLLMGKRLLRGSAEELRFLTQGNEAELKVLTERFHSGDPERRFAA